MAKEPELVRLRACVGTTALLRNDAGCRCRPESGADHPNDRTRPTLSHPPALHAARARTALTRSHVRRFP